MRMGRLIACALFVGAATAGADESDRVAATRMEPAIDWSSVKFEEIQGTYVEPLIQGLVTMASNARGADYQHQLDEGNSWACIARVLGPLATADRTLNAMDLSGIPGQEKIQYVRSWSGYGWDVWYQLALIGEVALEVELPALVNTDVPGNPEIRDLLDRNVLRVLDEMEKALLPLLDPGDSP